MAIKGKITFEKKGIDMAERRLAAHIDLDAVTYNFDQMKKNIKADTRFVGVIKADAYGHGAVPIGRLLEKREDVWGFAVATTEEALELRNNGIKKPIIMLGYTFSEDYDKVAEFDLRPAVFTLEMAKGLAEAAHKAQKKVSIHLALDTGMTRIGFADKKESVQVIKEIAAMDDLCIEGMFTHFARADESSTEHAEAQLQRYLAFADMLEEAGIKLSLRHVSNSAGIMQFADANLDLVRAGITVYGLLPSNEVRRDLVKLQPVMSLKSHVAYVKTVEAGVPISYGGTFVTERKSRVATIPAGYADGVCRGLSNKGYVLIKGQKAPIMGRVCMDQFMVDVTDIPDVAVGDEVTLLGKDGALTISLEKLGDLSGRFNYEYACCISKRVPRIYHMGGQRIDDPCHL